MKIGEGIHQQEMQLTYFCGSSALCSNSTNRGALQQAKQNLEMRYSVVGVVEQFNALYLS